MILNISSRLKQNVVVTAVVLFVVAAAVAVAVGDVAVAYGWVRPLLASHTACHWQPRQVKDLHRQSCK